MAPQRFSKVKREIGPDDQVVDRRMKGDVCVFFHQLVNCVVSVRLSRRIMESPNASVAGVLDGRFNPPKQDIQLKNSRV